MDATWRPCRRMSRPMTIARGSPVPITRAGQLVTPRARARPIPTPVSVCLYKCLSIARPCLPVCPQGPRQLVTGPPPPTRPRRTRPRAPPPRQLGQPTGRRLPRARAPARAPPPSSSLARARTLPVLAAPPRSYDGARARGSLLATSARARPNSLDLDLLDPRARASDGPSLTHTHRPRPAPIVRQTFPGPKVVPGRPTFAGRPRASHAAMCPGQLATALRHQAAARAALLPVRARARPSRTANWRGPMEGGDPREPVVAGPPRLRRRVSGPLQAPGAAGPVGYLTAYTTRLVTSVVCRGFIPARGDIAIRQPAPGVSPREPSPAC
ncbi:hypothetical protein P174DRAFT_479545 [Aspergillus novofumigatus IBT 16806]|uniref:Uncharacterized protein n=1 Tax=Aspergillus novofumigatus (strain IBT 16806) TaxID=1392255 RepID=A0A2I1BS46_ASPN1|nr:hypothetical protein P174DRAFT_479545 [Aspergillus novofumigatus IBT 16806]